MRSTLRSLTPLLLSAVVLAGCSTPPRSGLLPPTIQGPAGHLFAMSFPKVTPHKSVVPTPTIFVSAPHGRGVAWTNFSRRGDVTVLVYGLSFPIAPSQDTKFLGDFLISSSGEKRFEWHHLPALSITNHCTAVKGSCSGFNSQLVILDRKTVFDVVVVGRSNSVEQAVIDSFRIVN